MRKESKVISALGGESVICIRGTRKNCSFELQMAKLRWFCLMFLVASHYSIIGCVHLPVRLSVGPSVQNTDGERLMMCTLFF